MFSPRFAKKHFIAIIWKVIFCIYMYCGLKELLQTGSRIIVLILYIMSTLSLKRLSLDLIHF